MSSTETPTRPAAEHWSVPELARRPILLVAAVVGVALLATSWPYGYFGDELYFIAAGTHHPSWAYADQPWLVPLLAAAIDSVFPGSVVALRVPGLILTVLGLVAAAQIAREFGGAGRAQTITAIAYAISPQLLGSGHLLSTATLDVFCWTLIIWLVIRWVRVREDRLLLFAGLITAVDLQVKFLIPFFWVALVAVVLASGPRSLLTRPTLWIGGAVSVVATAPSLIWQVQHGWPQLEMQGAIAEQAALLGGRIGFLPLTVFFAGFLVGAFLLCHGFWKLLRSPELEPYRFIAWTAVVVTVVFIITNGKYYYVAGFYAPLFAASAVHIERGQIARWWRWVPGRVTFGFSAAFSVFLALPIVPAAMVNPNNFVSYASLGWQQTADTVAQAYQGLPPEDQADSAVLTQTFWQASALEVYVREELPPVHSPERGYWYFGPPSANATNIVVVGSDSDFIAEECGQLEELAQVPPEETGINHDVHVWICRDLRVPLPELWDTLRVL